MRCRVAETECLNASYCTDHDACCAGDPDCVPVARCPHSAHGAPATCSQCIGTKPSVVTQTGADIVVDGEVARPIAPGLTDAQIKYSRRGRKRT